MSFAILEKLLEQLRVEGWIAAMLAAVVLTGFGAYLYGLKPTLLELRHVRESLQPGAGDPMERARAHDATIAELQGRVAELRSRLYGESASLPPEQMESFIIDRLDALSVRRAVQLLGVTPGDAGRVLMFDELPYDVEVRGDYFSVHDWLHAVEEELRPMVVKRFEMRRGREEGQVSLGLRLVSYRPVEDPA